MKLICPCCGKNKFSVKGKNETTNASVYECVDCGCIFELKIRLLPERYASKNQK